MIEIYTRKNGTKGVRTVNDEPTKTQRQFAKDCDVNNIMRKYAHDGSITHLARSEGVYADLTVLPGDYRDMLEAVRFAQDAFLTLPAEVRKKFGNDPSELIQFLNDPKNRDEAVKLGLIDAKKIEAAPLKNDDLNDDKKGALSGTKTPKVPKASKPDSTGEAGE